MLAQTFHKTAARRAAAQQVPHTMYDTIKTKDKLNPSFDGTHYDARSAASERRAQPRFSRFSLHTHNYHRGDNETGEPIPIPSPYDHDMITIRSVKRSKNGSQNQTYLIPKHFIVDDLW